MYIRVSLSKSPLFSFLPPLTHLMYVNKQAYTPIPVSVSRYLRKRHFSCEKCHLIPSNCNIQLMLSDKQYMISYHNFVDIYTCICTESLIQSEFNHARNNTHNF